MSDKHLQMDREIAWCVTVIKHAAIRARREQNRFYNDTISLQVTTNEEDELVEFIPNERAAQDFYDSELYLLLCSLPTLQFLVLQHLYLSGETQQEAAHELHLTQQQVSRLKIKGLQQLRQELSAWTTPN
ncbi:MAG: hypothetical protein JWN30_601 [Bacilli bacterium]|nr:hypothetical protein [Bacilli bacterium]